MKEQLQRFYYKQIYANRKSIKNLIEAVTVTAFTWLVLSSISFHMIVIMGPLKLDQYCARSPRNGFTTLYYWFEYPGRTAGCWLWQSKEPKKLSKEQTDELMKFLAPKQECDLFSK